jgi:ubiquitin C-terminal hydrolase
VLTQCIQDGQQQDAEEFFRLYLDALDEELLALLGSSSSQKSIAAPPGEEREVSQSGQADAGIRSSKVRQLCHPFLR